MYAIQIVLVTFIACAPWLAQASRVTVRLQPEHEWQGAALQLPEAGGVTEPAAFFRAQGVDFPDGAHIRYVSNTSQLLVYNTQDNLERIRTILKRSERPARQVRIDFLVLSVPRKLIGDWGIDGPAAAAESSPLKRAVPLLLRPDQAQLVLNDLTSREDVKILAQAGCQTITGTTSTICSVERRQLVAGQETRKDGDERVFEEEELGAVCTVTPTIAVDGVFIQLDLEPSYRALIRRDENDRPILSVAVSRSSILTRTGYSALFCHGGNPSLPDSAILFVITAEIVRL